MTLFQISAPIPSDTIASEEDGKLNCMQQGARLLTPRSTRAIQFFEKYEALHVGKNEMFQFAPGLGRQTLGMAYDPDDPEEKILYR